LLKFFKLFGQRPNTEPESKGTIVSLDTQHPPRTEKTDIYLSTTTSNFGSKKSASTLQTWQNRSLLWSQKDGSNDGTTLIERSRWRGIESAAGVGVPTTFLPSAGGTSNE
jgi:hypothetical protein